MFMKGSFVHAATCASTLKFLFCRFVDRHTQVYFLMFSAGRWLGFRLDLLCVLFVTAVAIAGTLVSENTGIKQLYCLNIFTEIFNFHYFCMFLYVEIVPHLMCEPYCVLAVQIPPTNFVFLLRKVQVNS